MSLTKLEVHTKSDWLSKLAPEIVERIILFMPVNGILRLCECCMRLNEITRSEVVWEKVAERDYGVNLRRTEASEEKSARLFYLKVLKPYGILLGEPFGITNFTYYGGLMKVVYHNWSLCILELGPPPYPDVCTNLQHQMVCKISLDTHQQPPRVVFEQTSTDWGNVQSIEITNNEDGNIKQIAINSSSPDFDNSEDFDLSTGAISNLRILSYAKRLGLSPEMAVSYTHLTLPTNREV